MQHSSSHTSTLDALRMHSHCVRTAAVHVCLLLQCDHLSGCLQVYGYCMFKDEEEAKVNYPTEGFDGDVAGRSFHNGRFVQRLRQAAASMPSITIRQGIAKRLLNGVLILRRL